MILSAHAGEALSRPSPGTTAPLRGTGPECMERFPAFASDKVPRRKTRSFRFSAAAERRCRI